MGSRLLLRNGLVADGAGAAVRRADVLVDGPLIAWVGLGDRLPGECEVVDLPPGSVVCPGFIDAHVHAEGPLLASGCVEGALAQGVTTLVVGQDGQSWIGANAATTEYLNQYFGPVNGVLEPARELSVAAFADAVAGRLTQNVAVLASQGTIRHNVAALAPGPLDDGQQAAARRQVEEALADGAVGLSSGLDYLPSRFGEVAEISEMARPLADAGRPYVSHLRGYGPQVRAGLAELVAVGRGAKVRVHASHLWGPRAPIEAALRDADTAGDSLTLDMYPYRRSSTILASLQQPPEIQAGGPGQTLAALASAGRRRALLAGEKLSADYLQHVYLGRLPCHLGELAGLPVTEAADGSGRTAGEWVLDLLLDAELQVGAHLDRPGMGSGDLAWLISHDRFCPGSDGIYQGQHPHPRGYASFARLARHYLRGDISTGYQRLARYLAANPAGAYGLRGRGRIAAGMAADLCVIGPDGLTATASYGAPTEKAQGAELVIVNGTIAWRHGRVLANRTPGQLVT